ncbi:Cytokinin dehydrogenase 3 precursor family protein [Dorcoceras hygrometricum]|uniref:cytokinin dehydrogenase n=1 Tax=Dorcoceras hygrometricum TaxID=472368 RepID=A0A2Z7AIC9_9LAMI|nr:Cytokinin dehydrogenase 3 precursor family protein [Dorcoceras hygrometricum]
MITHCHIRPWHFIFYLVIITIFHISFVSAKPSNPLETAVLCKDQIPPPHIRNKILTSSDSITNASYDYGNIVHKIPSAVFYPSSITDIIELIEYSNNCSTPFSVAARGQGHSVRGQAMAYKGVVVEMASLSKKRSGIRVSWSSSSGFYADIGGDELWIDVLLAALKHGVTPVSWTDYLYLTVGGTLSNAGISGQSFLHGPQISNVLELDVITGKGELITCSKDDEPELFYAVLGGLGQFGIITRARIVMAKAPTRVKWVRLLYSNFSIYTKDQETLISSKVPNYVEGLLILNETIPDSWRSSFNSSSNQEKITLLLREHRLLYAIELVKYYDDQDVHRVNKEFEMLLKEMNFFRSLNFSADVSYFDFLARVPRLDVLSTPQSPTHPWLNLFVPKSRIHDFNDGVLVNLIPKIDTELIIFYPFNRDKWDSRMSAVTPDENIFYTLGLLHSSSPNETKIYDKVNNEILRFCLKNNIKIKQYLPHYKSREDWIKHYGSKWNDFQEMKAKFDPRLILSPGQRIFN